MTKPLRPMQYLSAALILLCSLVPVDFAHAAGRIFFDNFESGNTNLWMQAGSRDRCQVVTSASDGIDGPRSGKYMLRCNDNGSVGSMTNSRFETLQLDTTNYSNELFIRAWVRIDQNHDKTLNSSKKLLRLYVKGGAFDMFAIVRRSAGLHNEVFLVDKNLPTYWGNIAGDNSATTVGWHTIEYYFKQSPGTIKVWHDRILVRNATGLDFQGVRWSPFFITSNWSDGHDNVNHVYFDDVEIFSDTGTGATGLMSDATISAGPSITVSPPQNVRLNP